MLDIVDDVWILSFLSIFEEQVEELAHNPYKLGGWCVCQLLFHFEHISLPSIDIRLESLKGLIWREHVDEL